VACGIDLKRRDGRRSRLHSPRDRVSRLAIRLTYGIPGATVDLARVTGAELLRGDYCRLVSARICEPEQISAASDEQLLACVDRDRRKLTLIREASKRIAQRRLKSQKVATPVLEAYVA
jgi:hypothetical protein